MGGTSLSQIESVFHRVLAAPEGERDALLETLAAGDERLAEEVRSLVAAAAENEVLERLDRLADTVESWLEAIPERLGRYRIVRLVGEGGWGRVYEAEQEQPLRRRVAVKVLHPGMNSRSVLRRFRRELEVLARMEHPGIARVFDAGLTEQGLPYIVMEFIDGVRIDGYCESRGLSIRDRVGLLAQACRAVQHAHTKGVIHRDLKPSNMLVVEDEHGPRTVVIDFGIAKALTDDAEGVTLTGEQARPGTPEYMSPEQSNGLGSVDAKSDIYSLGVVLYRLTTGELPSSVKPGGGPAALPSEVARRHGETLPHEIDWIVRRCMADRPEDRYETVAALRTDLVRFGRKEPLEAGPPTAAYRARSVIRRHPLGVGLAGALLLALIVGGGLATWGFIEASQAWEAEAERAVEAETARSIASDRAAEAELVAGFLKDVLAGIDFREVGGEERKAVVGLVTRGVAGLDERDDLPLGALLELRRTMGSTLQLLGEYAAAADEFQKAVDLAVTLHGPRSREVVDLRFAMWNSFLSAGDPSKLFDSADEQIAAAGEVYGSLSRQQIRARQNYGLALERHNRLEEAESVLRPLIADLEARYGPSDSDTTGAMVNLAVTLGYMGRTQEAYDLQREAYRRMCETLPEDNHQRNLARLNLTGYLVKLGRYEEAQAEARAALGVWLSRRGDDDVWVSWAYKILAEIHEASGDVDAAVAVYQELIDRLTVRATNGQSTTQLDNAQRGCINLLVRNGLTGEARERAVEWGMEAVLDPPPS